MTDKPALPEGSKAIDTAVAFNEYVIEAESLLQSVRETSRNRIRFLAQENAEMKQKLGEVSAEISELRELLGKPGAPVEGTEA